MKRAGITSTAILFLLLGTTARAYAQHEQRGEEQGKSQQHQQAQPQHQQQQHQQAQPQHQQHRQQQTYGGAYHGGVQPNQVHPQAGYHQSGVPQHQRQVHSGFNQSRSQYRSSDWGNYHRTWGQRGGYNGYRIPDDRFRGYWGSNHYFRIYGLPMVFVGGYPRFQYDGYWVTLADQWPGDWGANWYQSDDVYVDYVNDGYYLFDRMHPGIPIAVTISF